MGYHRIGCRLWSGLPGCEREPEPNAPNGSNFLQSLNHSNFRERSVGMFLWSTGGVRLSLRQSGSYGENKGSGTAGKTQSFPINTAGESLLPVKTPTEQGWRMRVQSCKAAP